MKRAVISDGGTGQVHVGLLLATREGLIRTIIFGSELLAAEVFVMQLKDRPEWHPLRSEVRARGTTAPTGSRVAVIALVL